MTGVAQTQVPADGRWHRIEIVHHGQTTRTYIDGALCPDPDEEPA